MPSAPIPSRPVEEPTHDRAVGALLGAVAAAALVGTPPALAHRFTAAATSSRAAADPLPTGPAAADGGPNGRTGTVLLAQLSRTALEQAIAAPAAAPRTTDPVQGAWVRVLRSLVLTATPPAAEPDLEHTTNDDPLGTSWRALTRTPVPAHAPARGSFACAHLVDAVWSAYHACGDLAAMCTGALAGARWGSSALPLQALRRLSEHTDPHALTTAALVCLNGSHPDRWPQQAIRQRPEQRLPPFAVPHPLDPEVLLGNLDYLRARPQSVDAAVSLCRTHPEDAPHLAGSDWVRVWLHDTPGKNSNLHFTLDEAAAAVASLRSEGKRVLLHCWAGASRTPAVAARYAAATLGAPPLPTMTTLIHAVGGHLDNPTLSQAVAELSGLDLPDPGSVLFPQGLPARRPELRAVKLSG
ncbi:dual specificity protein phosphatase family protein [Nocardiopsis ganjiahuensis]|uniref:dual specificity protein phosphatase family protein n=1 Tax=Nocardiopsis ganjiahuensis TaxID=239984 RepID=UPI00034D5DF7|nr:dual specificity protein phosphatase family protein [Nocardiopsis ganjiahuensis]